MSVKNDLAKNCHSAVTSVSSVSSVTKIGYDRFHRLHPVGATSLQSFIDAKFDEESFGVVRRALLRQIDKFSQQPSHPGVDPARSPF